MTSVHLPELAEIVGPGNVLSAAADVERFTIDWRRRFEGKTAAVVRPGSTSEVAAVLKWASRRRCAIVPQGGNTGMNGGAIPDQTGNQIILSLERMRSIRSIDPVNDTIIVEAGCTLAAVQAAAMDVDRLFALSLGSEGSCQIGGNIATNAGGLEVVRYGVMRDLVLGLEVVLPGGEILSQLTQLRKNNTGYDLKQLFIGSEGTLGIITAAVLKLFPRPKSRATALCGLQSPEDALVVLGLVKERCGARLSTFEIISGDEMNLIVRHSKSILPLIGRHEWYLLVEITDPAADDMLTDLLAQLLADCMDKGVLSDAAIAQTEAQRAAFWNLRHVVSEANNSEGRVLSLDTSVPVSSNAEFIRGVEKAFAGRTDLKVVFVGHLGDGNVHTVAIFDRDKLAPDGFERGVNEVSGIVYKIASSLGGSISAEHGIGLSLRDKLPTFKDPRELALMRSIKNTIDPAGIMNPGKVLVMESVSPKAPN